MDDIVTDFITEGLERAFESDTDPDGSYTGQTDKNGYPPTQDADDL